MPSRATVGIGLVILAATIALSLAPSHAQQATQVDAGIFASLRWRELGPMRSGRTTAAAASPAPGVFYAGVSGAGLWRTNDFGASWRLVYDAPPRGLVTAVAVAPSQPSTIYVALDRGLVASKDAGRTWSVPTATQLGGITRIAVDARDASRLWIAARGTDQGPATERGLFHSVDSGATVERVLAGDPGAAAVDVVLAASPVAPGAAIYAAFTPGVDTVTAGPGRSSLVRSTDGGATWLPLTRGLPVSLALSAASIAVAASQPQRIYAAVSATGGSGLYRSDDRGDSWTLVTRDPRAFEPGVPSQVAVDARNADVVLVARGSVWRSTDGGRTLAPWGSPPMPSGVDVLLQSPTMPAAMMAGGGDGASITVNDGETWSSQLTQPTADVSGASTDTAFPSRVCGPLAGAATVCVPTFGDGRLAPGEIVPLRGPRPVTDPLDSDAMYGGAFERFDRRTGQLQDLGPVDAPAAPVAALAFAADGRTIYAAGSSLWRAATGAPGQGWTEIAPPALRDAAAGAVRPVSTALALSPLDARIVWVATSDGRLQVTRDAATTWRSVAGPSVTTPIWAVEASHFDGSAAYAVLAPKAGVAATTPQIWRTRDGGATWIPIVGGLTNIATVYAIREDPQRRGLLLAATDQSAWVSFDDGDVWQPLRLNLPSTPVRDITIRDASIIVATAGRGFWRLDDISALRQLTGDIARAQAYLFRPAPAWRLRASAADAANESQDAARAGAVVTYLIGPATVGRVALEIIETVTGDVIRRFEGSTGRQAATASSHSTDRLDATAGLHQIVWDLRYGRAVPDSLGPMVVAGTYQVKLTIGERVMRQAIVVRMDPRVRAGAADLAAQLKLIRVIDGKAAELQRVLTTTTVSADAEPRDALAALVDLSQRVQAADARPSARLEAAAAAAIGRADSLLAR